MYSKGKNLVIYPYTNTLTYQIRKDLIVDAKIHIFNLMRALYRSLGD